MIAVDPRNAAMSVAHVFAEANIRHDDEPGALRLNRSDRLLNDAVFSVRSAGRLVFLARNSKEQDGLQSQVMGALSLVGYLARRPLKNSRHAGNRLSRP